MDDSPSDENNPNQKDNPTGDTVPQENKNDWLVDNNNNVPNSGVGTQPPASPVNTPTNAAPANTLRSEPAIENALSSEPIVGPHSSGGGNGFKIFVIIGIIIILAVWGGVGYLYTQNRSLQNGSQNSSADEVAVLITPTPVFTPDQIKIKSGSIVREIPGGDTVTLIDKENYQSTGIIGFLKVAVSPDNNKICFESWPPAPEPALYVADINGQNVVEASPNRKNCLWSKDSNKIFYINTASNTAPVNIFEFDLFENVETDLTSDSVTAGSVRRYELVGLSADGSKIICRYENIGGASTSETIIECEVDLETGEVNIL